jgi:hypothetical protein
MARTSRAPESEMASGNGKPDVEITTHGWEELRTFGVTNNKYVAYPISELNIRQLSVVNILGCVSRQRRKPRVEQCIGREIRGAE